MWSPRPTKSMRGSPATSSAKRVQRSHWMQRSRSRYTGLEGEAPGTLDVDQAHATHTHRPHAGVVAEAGDVDPGPLGRGDHHLARIGHHLLAVDGDGDGARRQVSQRGNRLV